MFHILLLTEIIYMYTYTIVTPWQPPEKPPTNINYIHNMVPLVYIYIHKRHHIVRQRMNFGDSSQIVTPWQPPGFTNLVKTGGC